MERIEVTWSLLLPNGEGLAGCVMGWHNITGFERAGRAWRTLRRRSKRYGDAIRPDPETLDIRSWLIGMKKAFWETHTEYGRLKD